MNRRIILLVALVVLAMAGDVSAADTVEIRGTVQELSPLFAFAGYTWDAQSFAGFWYDIEKDVSSETLTMQALGAYVNTIPSYGLTYTATMQGAEYKNPSLNIAGNDYMTMGWFAKKYMAVNNQPDVLSKIIFEMGSTDEKTLVIGESWDLGNGYTLVAKQIDLDGVKVWLSLEKNSVEVESSIIDIGQNPCGDTFVNLYGYGMMTTDTFVYQPDIGSESDVPIFTVTVTAIFRGTDTNVVQLKYAMLIDDELLMIGGDYESHEMMVTSITATSITLQNGCDITLTQDSDIDIMGDIIFRVADDCDGDATTEYRFYPMVEYTDPGTYDVRGTVQELPPFAFAGYTWDAQSFAGFWYDIEKDVSSETLTMQAPGAYVNTIPSYGLTYTATMQGAEYNNPSLNIAGDDHRVMGWFAKKYMAVNAKPDVLSATILEMGSTDKKTLVVGESWDLGNGYTLIAKQIDLEGDWIWLSLEKNSVEVESSVIYTGATPSGNTFVDINGCDVTTTDTFVYQPDIGSESDVPIFTVTVTAIFRGTDTNVVQLKYAMLIDDELLMIGSDYESHEMMVTSITATSITLQNGCDITLTQDSDIDIMGDIIFRVADDCDGDATTEYRFYPMVERIICGVDPTPDPTPTVTATAEPTPTSTVTIADVTMQPGATQDVPIRLLGSTGVGGVTATLTFDPSIVDVTSAVAGDFNSIFVPDYSNVGNGLLRVTCSKSGTDLTGDLTITTVTLEAVGTSGSCELGLSAELSTASGVAVPSSTDNGTLMIANYDNIVAIGNTTVQPSATQDVPIRLLNSTGVGGVTATLTFDPSIVDVTSAVAGDFDSIFTPDYSGVSSGILRVTCTEVGTDLTGDLTIATVTLAAVATSGSCELGLSAELSTASGVTVPSSTDNGVLTISDRTPGDVTGDGNVNIGDAVLLFNWVSFPNERGTTYVLNNPENANVNGDTATNIGDAVLLFNWVSFPNERGATYVLQ